ncbi:MAG: hypothetical protein C5B54_01825, partial [Acidobacteria bacterium]
MGRTVGLILLGIVFFSAVTFAGDDDSVPFVTSIQPASEAQSPDNDLSRSSKSVLVYREVQGHLPGGKYVCSSKTSGTLPIKNIAPFGQAVTFQYFVTGPNFTTTFTVDIGVAQNLNATYCYESNVYCKNVKCTGPDTLTCSAPIDHYVDSTKICSSVSFNDVSESSGIEVNTIQTKAVQWIDYNRDGKLDLVLIGSNGNALFKNIGNGKFIDVTQTANFGNGGKEARGATWADIDNNGYPDVFVANAVGPPTLLLNQNGVFKDISDQISRRSSTQSAAGSWAGIFVDINNDKLIDLYVVNDGAPNQLFKHTGATQFTDISNSAHINFSGSGRSAVAADFNGDGYQDIYLVNYKQGNKLYINNKNETFTETSASAGVAYNGASVQAVVADYNNDQKPDILIVDNANSSFLYKNLGNAKFARVIPGPFVGAKHGIAGAFADYDLDGYQDLVLAQTGGANILARNNHNG